MSSFVFICIIIALILFITTTFEKTRLQAIYNICNQINYMLIVSNWELIVSNWDACIFIVKHELLTV